MAEPTRNQTWLSPKRLLIGLTALVIVALLFAPTSKSVDVPASLNSYSREPNGARGFYEVLNRLGFDHTKLTYKHMGRDFRLTDVAGNVIPKMLV